MDAVNRRQLEATIRARDFARAHPADDPAWVGLMEKLEALITRAVGVAQRERDALVADRAATERRNQLRRAMSAELVVPLVRIRRAASKEQTSLASTALAPSSNASHAEFRVAAGGLLDEVKTHADLFRANGMSAAMLADFEAAIGEFDELTRAFNVARTGHVQASAELDTLLSGARGILRLLDGFYRHHLRDDVAQRAAWRSARNVVRPERTATDAPVPPEPAAPPEPSA